MQAAISVSRPDGESLIIERIDAETCALTQGSRHGEALKLQILTTPRVALGFEQGKIDLYRIAHGEPPNMEAPPCVS